MEKDELENVLASGRDNRKNNGTDNGGTRAEAAKNREGGIGRRENLRKDKTGNAGHRPADLLRACFDKTLVWLNVFLFAMMVVVGTYQILVRYLFNRPSTVSEELLTYTFAWLSLLAATYVFGQRGHMRMGFLADRLEGKNRRVLGIGTECLTIAFTAVVMVYGGIRITMLTMTQKTASLGIPMGCVYGIVPVCGVLIMIYNGMNLMEQIAFGDGSGAAGGKRDAKAPGAGRNGTGGTEYGKEERE